MMALNKALKVLARCEADLRSIVTSAADNGDYDAVLRITSWAKQISLMLGNAQPPSTERKPSAETAKRTTAPAYPRFARRGDQLIKIGWSKSDKSEYEHKAPHRAAQLLARVVADAGKDGRIFQLGGLMPLADSAGNEIPDYQVYVVIAWWRSIGLLDQHGRQGYSIPNSNQLLQAVESAWTKLDAQ
jgi:hypothetical protein